MMLGLFGRRRQSDTEALQIAKELEKRQEEIEERVAALERRVKVVRRLGDRE